MRFTSKHQIVESDVVARVKAIDWFAHCGEPSEFDLTMEIKRVKSWPQAMKADKEKTWDYAVMEARNQLTGTIHAQDRERYRSWNEITQQFKDQVMTPLTKEVWEPFQQSRGLDIELVHSTRWNILAALMENAYIGSNHGSFFFLELLTIYEAGHLPCGWRGLWPQGALVVY